MSVFEDVQLSWGGKDYVIPANRVMKAIAVIEEHLTLVELSSWTTTKKIQVSRLASAYGALLRYTGVTSAENEKFPISDEEVYAGMFSENTAAIVRTATSALLELMIPKSLKKGSGSSTPRPTEEKESDTSS